MNKLLFKQYIKQILKENKFDNIKFSHELVEIMLDEAEETGKPVVYKKVSLEYIEKSINNIYAFVDFTEEPDLPMEPYYAYAYFIKDKEKFIREIFSIMKDFVYIKEFEKEFFKEIQKRDFKRVNKKQFSKKFPIRGKQGVNIISIVFGHDSAKEIKILLNGFVYVEADYRINNQSIRHPQQVIEYDLFKQIDILSRHLSNATDFIHLENLDDLYRNYL